MGIWEVQNPGTDGGAQPNALSSIISQAMHVLHLSTIVHLLSMDNFSPEGDRGPSKSNLRGRELDQ
jgi:hypothetical protein